MLYELILFYGSILGLVFFMLQSQIMKFRTLKEKAGLTEGDERNEVDFLEYAQKDAHWFLTNVQKILLFIFVMIK